eukprot:3449618-Pyramimonas_sp.AAC.1
MRICYAVNLAPSEQWLPRQRAPVRGTCFGGASTFFACRGLRWACPPMCANFHWRLAACVCHGGSAHLVESAPLQNCSKDF